jgi:hypothetical protein
LSGAHPLAGDEDGVGFAALGDHLLLSLLVVLLLLYGPEG